MILTSLGRLIPGLALVGIRVWKGIPGHAVSYVQALEALQKTARKENTAVNYQLVKSFAFCSIF